MIVTNLYQNRCKQGTPDRISLSSIPAFKMANGQIKEMRLDDPNIVQLRRIIDWDELSISDIQFDFPDSYIAQQMMNRPDIAIAICVKSDNSRIGKIVPAHLKNIF